MAVEIKLPSLGEGVESGDVLELLVAEGDQIEKDQGIVEMETDKATVIVPSDYAGKVTKIMVGEGDSVSVGDVIMTIDAVEGESDSKAPAKTEAPAAPPAKSLNQSLNQLQSQNRRLLLNQSPSRKLRHLLPPPQRPHLPRPNRHLPQRHLLGA